MTEYLFESVFYRAVLRTGVEKLIKFREGVNIMRLWTS